MQGGKNWILPKEINANRFFWDSHWLEIRARICRSFKGTRYRFSAWRAGTKPYLSYWPARLHRLAKSIPRNRCLGSINFYKYGFWSNHQTTSFPLWDRMEGACLWTPFMSYHLWTIAPFALTFEIMQVHVYTFILQTL